jgi:hypothetical protein
MSGSKCVPLALLACATFITACDRTSDAAAPDYDRVSHGTLALCSAAPERVYTFTAGADGAHFSVQGALVAIPPGALDAATEFTVRVPQSQFAEVEITANGQQQFNFMRPVTIGIDYGRCSTVSALSALTVWHIDPASKLFLEDMGGVNDTANKRVLFSTMHLSGYAIAN